MFKGAGLDLERPIVASCGTGVTASVLALALHQVSPSAKVRVHVTELACLHLRACLSEAALLALESISRAD